MRHRIERLTRIPNHDGEYLYRHLTQQPQAWHSEMLLYAKSLGDAQQRILMIRTRTVISANSVEWEGD